MTELDDKLLDDYLQRDSVVSQRYRALDAAEVPPEVDERVLAQARSAQQQAEATQGVKNWRRWAVPMTLAASLVLVTTVVVEVGVQQNLVKSSVVKSSTPPAGSTAEAIASFPSSTTEADKLTDVTTAKWAAISKEVAPATPAPLTLKKSLPQAAAGSQRDATASNAPSPALPESVGASATMAIAASQPMPSPPAVAAPITSAAAIDGENNLNGAAKLQGELKPDPTPSVSQADERSAAKESSLPATTLSMNAGRSQAFVASGASTSAAADKQTENAKPEQTSLQAMPQAWLDHIRTLRKQGKSQQADEEWQRFKQAWPQYPVTDNDAARSK